MGVRNPDLEKGTWLWRSSPLSPWVTWDPSHPFLTSVCPLIPGRRWAGAAVLTAREPLCPGPRRGVQVKFVMPAVSGSRTAYSIRRTPRGQAKAELSLSRWCPQWPIRGLARMGHTCWRQEPRLLP